MFDNIDIYFIFDMLLLLLIGMGPKIALVPFLDLTKNMEADMQKKVAGRMVQTAVATALLLVLLGWLLMRLLHFTPGAASVAGGIVLLLLALHMLVSPAKEEHHEEAADRDPMQMAIYPLAVPYLLNPAGIAVLVTASGELDSSAASVGASALSTESPLAVVVCPLAGRGRTTITSCPAPGASGTSLMNPRSERSAFRAM
jgi:multiple antibiotic resistance protein